MFDWFYKRVAKFVPAPVLPEIEMAQFWQMALKAVVAKMDLRELRREVVCAAIETIDNDGETRDEVLKQIMASVTIQDLYEKAVGTIKKSIDFNDLRLDVISASVDQIDHDDVFETSIERLTAEVQIPEIVNRVVENVCETPNRITEQVVAKLVDDFREKHADDLKATIKSEALGLAEYHVDKFIESLKRAVTTVTEGW
jgi:hypothetical protein